MMRCTSFTSSYAPQKVTTLGCLQAESKWGEGRRSLKQQQQLQYHEANGAAGTRFFHVLRALHKRGCTPAPASTPTPPPKSPPAHRLLFHHSACPPARPPPPCPCALPNGKAGGGPGGAPHPRRWCMISISLRTSLMDSAPAIFRLEMDLHAKRPPWVSVTE